MTTAKEFVLKWRDVLPEGKLEEFVRDLQEVTMPIEDRLFLLESSVTRDLRPTVTVRMGSYTFSVTAEEGRAIATAFVDASAAAEIDAFCYQFFTEKTGIPIEHVQGLVNEFRAWREAVKPLNQPIKGVKPS